MTNVIFSFIQNISCIIVLTLRLTNKTNTSLNLSDQDKLMPYLKNLATPNIYINSRLFFRIAPVSDDDETFFTDYMDHEEHFICWDRKSEMNVS